MILPIRLNDGKYYWVSEESTALQLDKDRNMVSSLHIFSIAGLYNPKQQKNLMDDDLLDDYFEMRDWMGRLRENYTLQKTVFFSP